MLKINENIKNHQAKWEEGTTIWYNGMLFLVVEINFNRYTLVNLSTNTCDSPVKDTLEELQDVIGNEDDILVDCTIDVRGV